MLPQLGHLHVTLKLKLRLWRLQSSATGRLWANQQVPRKVQATWTIVSEFKTRGRRKEAKSVSKHQICPFFRFLSTYLILLRVVSSLVQSEWPVTLIPFFTHSHGPRHIYTHLLSLTHTMAKSRLKMLPINLLALVGLMAWGAAASAGEPVPSSSPSPSPDVDLICHTDNPAECYPKLFQPTDEFQIVHPDQDLPLGLHVRLDVNTGLKEAKINVPDENDPALAGLPVDSSVVIVEPGQQEEPIIPRNAPAYDKVGKIKTPKSAANPGEGSAFFQSLAMIKKGLDMDGALETLEEISHDIYYGLKIAEDYDTLHALLCLSTSPTQDADTATLHRARLASLTLASTFQNNPSALASLENYWPKLSVSHCAHTPTTPLSKAIFTLLSTPTTDLDPSLTKARTNLLSALLKSPIFRTPFLASSAPSHLLGILTTAPEKTEWQAAQRAAAFLLLDNFLDADMGATLGEWPAKKTKQFSDGECAELFGGEGGEGKEEKCLFWLVRGLKETYKSEGAGHWSWGLEEKLRDLEKKKGSWGWGGKSEL